IITETSGLSLIFQGCWLECGTVFYTRRRQTLADSTRVESAARMPLVSTHEIQLVCAPGPAGENRSILAQIYDPLWMLPPGMMMDISGACPLLIQISGTMRSKHTPHPRGDMPEPSEPAESNGRPISSQSGFKRPVNVRVPYALRTQILLYPIQVCQMRSG